MQEPNKKHKCEWGQCGKCNPNIHGSAGGVAPKEEVSGEDWSEEFDKIAPKIDWRGYPSRETIKAFIKQTIEKERVKYIEKGRLSVLQDFDDMCLADGFVGFSDDEWKAVKKFFAINKQISKWDINPNK